MRIHGIFFASWMFIASVAFGGAGSEAEKQTRKPVAKKQDAPLYPERAQTNRLEGTVVVDFVVSSAGKTKDVKVVGSSGHNLLDVSAICAVRKWRFVPAKRDGKAVDCPLRQELEFRAPSPDQVAQIAAKLALKPKKKVEKAADMYCPKPFYPGEALFDRKAGGLTVEFRWGTDGGVHDLKLRKSSGVAELDLVALATVYCEWWIDPVKHPDKIGACYILPVEFVLR